MNNMEFADQSVAVFKHSGNWQLRDFGVGSEAEAPDNSSSRLSEGSSDTMRL